jgi:exopolysaccharide biosynthesis polyprenyl glycosylphosphotransferase
VTTTREGKAGVRVATAPGPEPAGLAGRRGFWKDALRRRLLAAADAAAVLIAALAVGVAGEGTTAIWIAATTPIWLLLAKLRGLYDRDHVRIRHLTLDEASDLFHWVTLCAIGTTLIVTALPDASISVAEALVMSGAAFVAAFCLRVAARALWRSIVPPERGLLVGTGRIADAFARRLELESGHHLTLVGRVGLANGNGHGGDRVDIGDLDELIREQHVERIVVALHDLNEDTLSQALTRCRGLGVKLSVAPPMRAMFGTAVDLNHLAELPLIEFKTWDTSRSTMLLKRSLDVVGSGLALVFLSPLLLLIAMAVRLDSRGPALFRQRRAGRGGEPFEMLKFRTMVDDAQARLPDLIAVDALAEPAFKLRKDPRVTRVGRLLRRTSLDELPQLVNVLRGQMSLVGPRPEELWLVERYEEADRFRLDMRPGITGPMQVSGRGELAFHERTSVEREYVENYSLRKDIKILIQTVAAVIHGRGAF